MIWGFGLPSGLPEICLGMTPTCRAHCYAIRSEAYRAKARAKYQRNWEISQLPDFAQRMRYFILNHDVKVVRIHTGGEFHSPHYARQWLRIIRWLPDVRFYCYTRAWQIAPLKRVIDRMADYHNARVWYSCDRDTGLPSAVPARVRISWLMTRPDEIPPSTTDLVFRVARLRRQPQTRLNGVRICPDETGKTYSQPPHCESCGYCWRLFPGEAKNARKSLPMIPAPSHSSLGERVQGFQITSRS